MRGLKYILFFCWLAVHAFARSPEQGEFTAATNLGDQIAKWVSEFKPLPKTLGIFSVRANDPLDQDYATLLETEILKSLAKVGIRNVMSCTECRAPVVTVQEDKLIITKGPLGAEAISKIGKSQPVNAFLKVDIYRAQFSVLAQVALYENPSGTVLSSERFSATAIDITDVSVQVLFNFGLGKVLTGANPSNPAFAYAGNLSLVEEVGFAKGGVNIGGVLDPVNGTLIYVDPTLAFRGHFGTSAVGWSWFIGAGYGFTSAAKGPVLRTSFEVFLSPLAELGLEGIYLIPDSASATLTSFAGFHIGLALGR